ncbi:ATP-binding protein [Litchfieldia alkalitelluris]|uniref:ATP-binding protein n=1 Tax=Litchfieldia alkalitelluris TaxID=304268 RepID=UPI00195C29E0|nr:ATP-binding protein [Litchfieldia alkalitelluris]
MTIATTDDIVQGMNRTKQLARERGFSENIVMKLQLVTEEASTNAYEYCAKHGLDSHIVIWNITNSTFELIVRQKGSVFPIVQENDLKSGMRGRGLKLIVSLMDQVEVREQGEFIELYMKKEKENGV